MNRNSVGLVEEQRLVIGGPEDPMSLESGLSLGPVEIVYETYGEPNQDRSNAILLCHALSGDAHAAGYHHPHDQRTGWWDAMVGPGRAFDTNKYWIICSNIIGGCKGSTGPGSIDPHTGIPYGTTFPVITIGDMVEAQKKLIDHLGIPSLHAVVGGSMGGFQVLEWALRFPEQCRSAIVIASSARLSAQGLAFNAVGRHAIISDPGWMEGDYYGTPGPVQGLAIARMIGHITYLSEAHMDMKFGRKLQSADRLSFKFSAEFAVESYLKSQGERFTERFDANSYLFITKAMDYFDIAESYGSGSLDEALAQTDSKFLIVSYSSDWLFTTTQSREIVRSLIRNAKDVSFVELNFPYGHDSFLIDKGELARLLIPFLESVESKGEGISVTDSQKDHLTRADRDLIIRIVPAGARVLDLGCGDGSLLAQLIEHKEVRGHGVDIDESSLIRCIERGISACQYNLDEGLKDFPNDAYDYVILNQTLQMVKNPERVIGEMLRVGRYGIVGFPNFGYWRLRADLLFRGQMPRSDALPFEWYDTPNIRQLTIRDFKAFCVQEHVSIIREEYYMLGKWRQSPLINYSANLLAVLGMFVLKREK